MNYGGLEKEFSLYENSGIVILPVPYDGSSTWMKGADKGPEAIISASANMELYDIETDAEVYKRGIFTAPPVLENSNPESMSEAVVKEVRKHIDRNKYVVTLGGEHSVSIGAIKAHAEAYEDVTILQIDAHADLRDSYLGSKYNHACVMARAKEHSPILQLGIRSMDSSEKKNADYNRIIFGHEIKHDLKWIERVLRKLTRNVYITFDLDAFDPSQMPSTGTPEPGGISWTEAMDLLEAVNDKANIIGFDVVELCPNPANKAPDFLASKLIYRILSMAFNN